MRMLQLLKTSLLMIFACSIHMESAYASWRSYDDDDFGRNYNQTPHQINTKLTVAPRTPYPAISALWLTQTPLETAQAYAARTSPAVPNAKNSVILRGQVGSQSWISSVENQGELGTCSSFATVECLKYAHGRLLSQAYMIVKSEALEDCLNNGLSIGSAMKITQTKGVIGQSWWTYDDYLNQVKAKNRNPQNKEDWDICLPVPYSQTAEQELIKFGFKNIINIFLRGEEKCGKDKSCWFSKSDLIKDYISKYQAPVVISVPVEWNAEWYQGNIRTSPKNVAGWHAITIYGFDNSTQTFNFKNSWGSGWGRNGLGTIGYNYIQNHANEAWIGYDKEMRQ